MLSISLGVGATTAIFSLVETMILRPLPVTAPQQLEQIIAADGRAGFSYPLFREIRERNTVFAGVFARAITPATLVSGGSAERGSIEIVSANYFQILGVTPALGRRFSEEEDRAPMSRAVVVVSDHYWRDHLSADAQAAGKSIRVNNYLFTIIGVAPASFHGVEVGSDPDVWVPIMMQPAVLGSGRPSFDEAGWMLWTLMARRAPGVSAQKAQAGINVTVQQILNGNPALRRFAGRDASVRLNSAAAGLSRVRNTYERPLYNLLGIVGMLLLIACSNIASLLLARSDARRREIAIRLAVGARRSRLIRQLLTESMLLAIAGGALGVAMAVWTARALLRFLPAERIPLSLDVPISAPVLIFGLAASVLTGLLFGLVPALQATRVDLAGSMKQQPANQRRFDLRRAAIVIQVALSLVLVMGAGLFIGSLRNALSTRLGLNTESVATATVNPALSGYTQPQVAAFYAKLDRALAGIESARAAGMAETPLLSGSYEQAAMGLPGERPGQEGHAILLNRTGGDFFGAVGIPIVRGRGFESSDTSSTAPVALINETTAKLFGGADPIGQTVSLRGQNLRIVGMVGDSKYGTVREETPAIAYLCFQQEASPTRERTLYVRTTDAARSLEALRGVVHEIDPNLPVYNLRTLARQKLDSLARERLMAMFSGFFGAVALALAGIGLYGVISGMMAGRRQEIAIRMSLGARRGAVVWMALRSALSALAAGVALGLPLAWWLARFTQPQLFGIDSRDPRVLALAIVALAMVAVLAATRPAIRAARTDPAATLRTE